VFAPPALADPMAVKTRSDSLDETGCHLKQLVLTTSLSTAGSDSHLHSEQQISGRDVADSPSTFRSMADGGTVGSDSTEIATVLVRVRVRVGA